MLFLCEGDSFNLFDNELGFFERFLLFIPWSFLPFRVPMYVLVRDAPQSRDPHTLNGRLQTFTMPIVFFQFWRKPFLVWSLTESYKILVFQAKAKNFLVIPKSLYVIGDVCVRSLLFCLWNWTVLTARKFHFRSHVDRLVLGNFFVLYLWKWGRDI